MDNIINENEENQNTLNKFKKRFSKNMKKKKIDITYLTNKQIDELSALKYKNDTIILDEDTKIKEIERIKKETDELNEIIHFLTNNYKIELKDQLKLETNNITQIKRTLNPLSVLKKKSFQTNKILNNYLNKIIDADNIDFFSFFIGNQDDIFKIIYDSFITPRSKYVVIKNDSSFKHKPHSDFILMLDAKKKKTSNVKDAEYLYMKYKKLDKENIKYIDFDKRIEIDKEIRFNDLKLKTRNKLSDIFIDIIDFIYPGINRDIFIYDNYNQDTSFIDMCIDIHNTDDVNEKKNKIDKYSSILKKNFLNYFNNLFQIYYLRYLSFSYINNKNNIYINPKNILTNTKDLLSKYLSIIEDILINILKTPDYLEDIYNLSEKYYQSDIKFNENEIYKQYIEDLNNNFTTGYLLSTLYTFNTKNNYNISEKFLRDNYWTSQPEAKIDNVLQRKVTDVDDYCYYFDKDEMKLLHINNNIKYIEYLNSLNKIKGNTDSVMYSEDLLNDIRIVLSKRQLKKMYDSYHAYFKVSILILQRLIQKYELTEKKYLFILDLFVLYDKKHFESNKDIQIKNQLFRYFKTTSIQTNKNIIFEAKPYFSKIISQLNNKLLTIINDKSNISRLIERYENFITEYSFWIINLFHYISNYPNNSNQIYELENILSLFINRDIIKEWYNKCIKNNLNYWIPVYYSAKDKFSFFYNIINQKKTYNIKPNELIIVKFKNKYDVNDDLYCWNNNNFNIIVENNYDRIMIFLKKYIKCQKKLDVNDFNVIKNLINTCDNSKEEFEKMIKKKEEMIKKFDAKILKEIEELNEKDMISKEMNHACKNLLSYQQVIKEIVKIKYPLRINNSNNFSHLDTMIKKYQNELYEEYQSKKNVLI